MKRLIVNAIANYYYTTSNNQYLDELLMYFSRANNSSFHSNLYQKCFKVEESPQLKPFPFVKYSNSTVEFVIDFLLDNSLQLLIYTGSNIKKIYKYHEKSVFRYQHIAAKTWQRQLTKLFD